MSWDWWKTWSIDEFQAIEESTEEWMKDLSPDETEKGRGKGRRDYGGRDLPDWLGLN